MGDALITNKGKEIIVDRTFLSSPTMTVPSQFKAGVGTTDPALGDTDLEHPIPISGTESVDDCETADWTDSADMTTSLNSSTYKEGSNSLNLTKDGTASATAYTYKTTTSRDFTSKDLSVWVYIKDSTAYGKLATTSCLVVRFGSDSSNYYYWNRDKSELAVGWNLVDGLTSSNADGTTGTPTIGACDYTYVGLTATGAAITWSAGDFAMDDIKVISSDDYLKNFDASYPQIDYTNHQAVAQCRLNTTEANGYSVSEMGVFNTDSPILLLSRANFNAISKTSDDELIFETKYLIE